MDIKALYESVLASDDHTGQVFVKDTHIMPSCLSVDSEKRLQAEMNARLPNFSKLFGYDSLVLAEPTKVTVGVEGVLSYDAKGASALFFALVSPCKIFFVYTHRLGPEHF